MVTRVASKGDREPSSWYYVPITNGLNRSSSHVHRRFSVSHCGSPVAASSAFCLPCAVVSIDVKSAVACTGVGFITVEFKWTSIGLSGVLVFIERGLSWPANLLMSSVSCWTSSMVDSTCVGCAE